MSGLEAVRIEAGTESEAVSGPAVFRPAVGGACVGVGHVAEIESACGPYARYAPGTADLARLSYWWMKQRKLSAGFKTAWSADGPDGRAWAYDFCEDFAGAAERARDRFGAHAKKLLMRHPLGPWLEELPGLGGPTTAYLVGRIRDPWRFPGQRCEKGHYVRPEFEEGAPCPVDSRNEDDESVGRCGAPLLAPRRGTGCRALSHYCGLFPGAKKRAGRQASWVPELKGLLLAPDTGLAAQIVRHGPEPYRTRYDDEKARLMAERGYRSEGEVVEPVERRAESERPDGRPPPLIQLDRIARVIAVKQFVGDLLMEWKRRQPLGSY